MTKEAVRDARRYHDGRVRVTETFRHRNAGPRVPMTLSLVGGERGGRVAKTRWRAYARGMRGFRFLKLARRPYRTGPENAVSGPTRSRSKAWLSMESSGGVI